MNKAVFIPLGFFCVLAAFARPTMGQVSGLVAAYGFSEGSGTLVADLSGNANHGTISGATWTASGRFGSALSFNGLNSWVTVNDANSLDLTTGMTLEAWVNPRTLSSWREVVFKERTGGLSYALYANTAGNRPAGYIRLSSDVGLSGTLQLPVNSWTHLAVTYDGVTLRLFVNGTQVGSRAVAGSIPASTSPLRMGGNAVWGEYFDGLIDEVRVYNRALTQAEIQNDMNTPVGAASPPPDTTPPDTTITANPPAVSNSASASFSFTATEAGSSFQCSLDGGVFAPCTSPQGYTGLVDGAHSFQVRATDVAGNTDPTPASYAWVVDTRAPVISNVVAASITTSTTAISWTTDEASDSQVEYGATTAYGSSTPLATAQVTTHSMSLSGLTSNTLYHYRVKSRDAAGNLAVSADFTFTTIADTTPPTVSLTSPAAGTTVSGTITV